MELVYLWIDKYKNIENQGFNFSPKFKCSFNRETNKLIIEEKETKSIFPENINITAIVGKNGNGKNGIIEIIYFTMLWFSTLKFSSTILSYNNLNSKEQKFLYSLYE